MKKINYEKAMDDLYDIGACYPEDIYESTSENSFDEYMREYGLDPNKYKTEDKSASTKKGSGSKDGCFLTTACVSSKGLPDDCDELQTLRAYRDGYLSSRENGKDDIARYYDIAPKIVSAVSMTPEPSKVWDSVYNELVLPCVGYIKDGRNEDAYELYREYTLKLKKEYLG